MEPGSDESRPVVVNEFTQISKLYALFIGPDVLAELEKLDPDARKTYEKLAELLKELETAEKTHNIIPLEICTNVEIRG